MKKLIDSKDYLDLILRIAKINGYLKVIGCYDLPLQVHSLVASAKSETEIKDLVEKYDNPEFNIND